MPATNPIPPSRERKSALLFLAISALVFVLLSVITLVMANKGLLMLQLRAKQMFETYTSEIHERLSEKATLQTSILFSLKGLLLSPTPPTEDQFHFFLTTTQAFERSPSLVAVGFAASPSSSPSAKPTLTLTQFESPLVSQSLFTQVLENTQTEHQEALTQASVTGRPAYIPVVIPESSVRYGFLMFVPAFTQEGRAIPGEGRGNLKGMIVGLFSPEQLFSRVIRTPMAVMEVFELDQVVSRVSGNSSCLKATCLADLMRYPLRDDRSIKLGELEFKLIFAGEQYFGQLPKVGTYITYLFVLGILGDFLIACVVFLFNSSHERALSLAMRVTASIRDSERKYRTIFDSFPDIYLETDDFGLITTITPSVTKLLGFSDSELIGQPLDVLLRDTAKREEFLQELRLRGLLSDFEIEITSTSGKTITFAVDAHELREDDHVSGITCTFHDVSERIAKRDALSEKTLELERINRILLEREVKMAELKEENRKLREGSSAI